MLAKPINSAFGVVDLQQPKLTSRASQRRTQRLKNLSSSLKNRRHQLFSILITLRPPRKLGKRKKRTIGNIDNPAGQTISPPRPSQPPGVTQPTTLPENLGLRKTSAKLSVITVTKKNTMQPSVPSHPSDKTSVSLGNLRDGDWC